MNNMFKGGLIAIAFMLSSFAAKAQEAGGTLAFLVQPEPPTLASYVSTSGPIGLVMPKVYEGLFDYDNDGKMVPMLAESYDISADGKTVTFNLKFVVIDSCAQGTAALSGLSFAKSAQAVFI